MAANALKQRWFGIGAEQADFARRGFVAPDLPRRRLEEIGRTFIIGYNAALQRGRSDAIDPVLIPTEPDLRGFAYEGAAMGFALLDILSPWPARRFARFIAGPGQPHIYMAYVGAGWALARTSHRLAWRLGPLDPLLRWLMFDGYGFHDGYFHPQRSIVEHRVPQTLRGNARAVFDQGLGRAIWFQSGADVVRVAETVTAFPTARQIGLWSGVGLAAAYAGGVELADLDALHDSAGPYRPQLAQGAAFAAQARQRAGNPAPHTDLACRALCRMEATRAAAITQDTLSKPRPGDRGEAYEAWRAAIAAAIAPRLAEPVP